MMHRSSSLLWILIWVTFSGVRSSPVLEKCPEVKAMDPFDLEAYMGTWYQYVKYPDDNFFDDDYKDIEWRCKYMIFDIIDNSRVSIRKGYTPRYHWYGPNFSAIEQIVRDADKSPNRSFQVLGTDYKSFAVAYKCPYQSPSANYAIWIITRDPNPSVATIDAARKVLEDNSLNQTFLNDVIPTECPQLGNYPTRIISNDRRDIYIAL